MKWGGADRLLIGFTNDAARCTAMFWEIPNLVARKEIALRMLTVIYLLSMIFSFVSFCVSVVVEGRYRLGSRKFLPITFRQADSISNQEQFTNSIFSHTLRVYITKHFTFCQILNRYKVNPHQGLSIVILGHIFLFKNNKIIIS